VKRQRLMLAVLCTAAFATDPAIAGSAYVRQGNTICRDALQQLKALPAPTTADQVVSYLQTALPIAEHELAQLQALHPPARGKAPFRAALAGAGHENSILSSYLQRLSHGSANADEFASVEKQLGRIDPRVNANFRRAGLAECAK
jgi:hypothetical protein